MQKDGVLVVKRDAAASKHNEIEVPNIEVMKLLESLKSRGFVTLQFNWLWFYYTLTDTGIAHLREYLHLPEDIVPNSLKKPAKVQASSYRSEESGRGIFSDFINGSVRRTWTW